MLMRLRGMMNNSTQEESKRIQKFKSEIIKDLPFFPNTKEVKEELEAQSLNGIIIYYITGHCGSLRHAP